MTIKIDLGYANRYENIRKNITEFFWSVTDKLGMKGHLAHKKSDTNAVGLVTNMTSVKVSNSTLL